jgi:Ser-tRNA(Ala) deacylase AlaX
MDFKCPIIYAPHLTDRAEYHSYAVMASLKEMHTAEHILTRVMKDHFGCTRNFEMHLGEKKSKCDYDVSRELSEEDIRKIEALVNAEIKRGHPVTSKMIPLSEAAEYDLWKVPDGVTEIRIVKIGDFDATPCAGEHVENTAELGCFKIISYTRRENGLLRIRFKLLPWGDPSEG